MCCCWYFLKSDQGYYYRASGNRTQVEDQQRVHIFEDLGGQTDDYRRFERTHAQPEVPRDQNLRVDQGGYFCAVKSIFFGSLARNHEKRWGSNILLTFRYKISDFRLLSICGRDIDIQTKTSTLIWYLYIKLAYKAIIKSVPHF